MKIEYRSQKTEFALGIENGNSRRLYALIARPEGERPPPLSKPLQGFGAKVTTFRMTTNK
jgi:hypothetical protein